MSPTVCADLKDDHVDVASSANGAEGDDVIRRWTCRSRGASGFFPPLVPLRDGG